MPGTGPMNCDELRGTIGQGHALTAAEAAHVERCEDCREAWLDAMVTRALDVKPEIGVPADFAARVAAGLPEKRLARDSRGRARHWGLLTAVLLVAIGLVAVALADPVNVHTWMGATFMTLVVTEIAGIALWLGTDWPSSHTASGGRSRSSRA